MRWDACAQLKSFGKLFGKKRSSSSGSAVSGSGGSLSAVDQLTRGWAVERGGDQPLLLPLIGAPPSSHPFQKSAPSHRHTGECTHTRTSSIE